MHAGVMHAALALARRIGVGSEGVGFVACCNARCIGVGSPHWCWLGRCWFCCLLISVVLPGFPPDFRRDSIGSTVCVLLLQGEFC